MFRTLSVLFAVLAFASATIAQQTPLKVGDDAPPLQASQWIQGTPVSEFQKDKVYVLEFWATWCGSCHVAMRHLNQLVETFKDKPVEIISISDEERAKVEPMVKLKSMQTSVALDDGGKTFASYGVRVIPHTVVIADQKNAAITYPEHVTEQVLNDLLADKPVDLPFKSNQTANLEWAEEAGLVSDDVNAVGTVVLERTDAVSGASKASPDAGTIVGDGLSLTNLVMLAYKTTFDRIDSTLPDFDRGPYRVFVQAGDGTQETARKMLAAFLKASFDFEAEWVQGSARLPVLRRKPGTELSLKRSESETAGGTGRGGEIDLIRTTPDQMASLIGMFGFGKQGINETGLEGFYDFNLVWTPGSMESLQQALAKKGLEIVIEEREVQKLSVTPATN